MFLLDCSEVRLPAASLERTELTRWSRGEESLHSFDRRRLLTALISEPGLRESTAVESLDVLITDLDLISLALDHDTGSLPLECVRCQI